MKDNSGASFLEQTVDRLGTPRSDCAELGSCSSKHWELLSGVEWCSCLEHLCTLIKDVLIDKQARFKGTFLTCQVGCFVPCTSCYMSLAPQFWSSCLVTVFQIDPLARLVSYICLGHLCLQDAIPYIQSPCGPEVPKQSNKGLSPSKTASSLRQVLIFTPAVLICLIRATASPPFSEDCFFGDLSTEEWLTAFSGSFFLPDDVWLSP